MPVLLSEEHQIRQPEDVVLVRQAVRQKAVELGFNLVDQTKLVTAASELARNTLQYGGGGTLRLESLVDGLRRGLRLTFADARRGAKQADLCDSCAGNAPGQAVARRGRRPKSASAA